MIIIIKIEIKMIIFESTTRLALGSAKRERNGALSFIYVYFFFSVGLPPGVISLPGEKKTIYIHILCTDICTHI